MGMWRRLGNLLRRERLDADIDAELRAHMEMAVEDAIRSGMSDAEARRVVRLRFGNPMSMRERTSSADTLRALEELWRDLRYTFRQLRRSPVFTATAVITLALGIGATTAIFTLIQQVMLRSLPVRQPDQLWRIGDGDRCCYSDGYAQQGGSSLRQNNWSFFSWDAYRHFHANTSAFENLAAFQVGEANAYLAVRRAGSSSPVEMRNGEYISGNFFETFGIWRGVGGYSQTLTTRRTHRRSQ